MSTVFIRASSLSTLFDCPARFEAVHILGMTRPKSAAAQLGTAVHASTGLFDASRLPGGNPVTADEAAGALVDAIHKPEDEVDWDEIAPRDAEKIGLTLHTRYCAEIAPTQTYRGVEVTCEKLEIPDLDIVLTGTTDRVRETSAGLGIADIKTGARAVGADGKAVTQGHSLQLGVYELLAEHAMGMTIAAPAQIIAMQTGKATQRVGTGEVSSARTALVGTAEQPGMLEHASKLIHSGLFFGNSRSMLCSAKYCPAHPTCPFRA